MEEQRIKAIIVILALVGLLALYIISINVKLDDFNLASEEEDVVNVEGRVVSYEKRGSVNEMKVYHCILTEAVSFEDIPDLTGKNVSIKGRVGSYQGKKQIIVEGLKYYG